MLQISKYSPKYIFDKTNQIRQFLGFSRITEYNLVSKIQKADISQIDKEKHWRIPQGTTSFDYVSIGKKFDEGFSREIISFFDEKGKLIQRVFRENGKNTKQRTYKYDRENRTIDQRIFDTSRISDDIKDINLRNMWGMWKKEFIEHQWITRLENVFTKNGKQAISLKTKRSTFLSDDETVKKITFTEFAPNYENKNNRKNIKVTGILEQKPNMIKIDNIETENITLDPNDKLLPLRFLDLYTPEGIKTLSKYYISKKGLQPLNIYIVPNSERIKDNTRAFFDPTKGEIHYSPNLIKRYILDIVCTVAHEVEHAWQHCQIGRLGKGCSEYELNAFKKFGEIESFDDREEAFKYVIAKEQYPKLSDTEDLTKNMEYKNNYLEVKARLAGEKAAENFEQSDNFEFFDQF